MRIHLSIACLWLLLSVASCTRKASYQELVGKQLTKLFPAPSLSGYRCIVLIPNGGCPGCVLQAEDYFLHHLTDSTTLFVFTNFASRKDLAIKLGKESVGRSNVWLDYDNQLFFPQCDECIYPCAIFVEDGKAARFANFDELISEE